MGSSKDEGNLDLSEKVPSFRMLTSDLKLFEGAEGKVALVVSVSNPLSPGDLRLSLPKENWEERGKNEHICRAGLSAVRHCSPPEQQGQGIGPALTCIAPSLVAGRGESHAHD